MIINESYFNDHKNDEISVNDITQNTPVDTANDIKTLGHFQDSNYSYILNLYLFMDKTIVKRVYFEMFNFIENIFNNILCCEYARPLVVLDKNGPRNDDFFKNTKLTYHHYKRYNLITNDDNHAQGCQTNVVYAFNNTFYNSKDLYRLFKIILMHIKKLYSSFYSSSPLLTIRKNDIPVIEYSDIDDINFVKIPLIFPLVFSSIKDQTKDKYTYYHIAHSFFKDKWMIPLIKVFEEKIGKGTNNYNSHNVHHIDVSNLNRDVLVRMFHMYTISTDKTTTCLKATEHEDFIMLNQDILYFWILPGHFGNKFYEKIVCFPKKTVYHNNEEYAIYSECTIYDKEHFNVEDDEHIYKLSRLIIIGMLMYNCKTFDEFISICQNDQPQELKNIYEILITGDTKSHIETLRPAVQKIWNHLHFKY